MSPAAKKGANFLLSYILIPPLQPLLRLTYNLNLVNKPTSETCIYFPISFRDGAKGLKTEGWKNGQNYFSTYIGLIQVVNGT